MFFKNDKLHRFKLHASLSKHGLLNTKSLYSSISTVKLEIKELLNKKQIGFKDLFTDYQPFYTIILLLNKELWQSRKCQTWHK